MKFDRLPHQFIDDYNTLQSFTAQLDARKPSDQIRLIAIDATGSCISGLGCLHFVGLRWLEELRLVRCHKLTDEGFTFMTRPDAVVDSLLRLHIESCPLVTERGLTNLGKLRAIQSLTLRELRWVNKKSALLDRLRKELPPHCFQWRLEDPGNGNALPSF